MKILDARVRWYDGYANDPVLEILVDEVPNTSSIKHHKIDLGNGVMYIGQKEGYVHYVFHNPRDEEGFGGALFNLPMEDGEVEKIKGPWSSRAGVINQLSYHFKEVPQVVDVAIGIQKVPNREWVTHMAGSITKQKAEQAIRKMKEDVYLEEVIKFGEKPCWIPRRKPKTWTTHLPAAEQIMIRAYVDTIETKNRHGEVGVDDNHTRRIEQYFEKRYGKCWRTMLPERSDDGLRIPYQGEDYSAPSS